jgi:hypothetical protein
MRSRAGGYEQEGHVFSALRQGLASLVIDRSGRARIGAWGTGVPAPGEAVYSVRQKPVAPGQPRPAHRRVGPVVAVGRDHRRRRVCGPQRPGPGCRRGSRRGYRSRRPPAGPHPRPGPSRHPVPHRLDP